MKEQYQESSITAVLEILVIGAMQDLIAFLFLFHLKYKIMVNYIQIKTEADIQAT